MRTGIKKNISLKEEVDNQLKEARKYYEKRGQVPDAYDLAGYVYDSIKLQNSGLEPDYSAIERLITGEDDED